MNTNSVCISTGKRGSPAATLKAWKSYHALEYWHLVAGLKASKSLAAAEVAS